jgi:hypothetical protein
MRAANGTGIISTWILESDDLDEIDWVRPSLLYTTTEKESKATNPSHRSKLVPIAPKFKPTTSARGTPPPTTAAQQLPSPPPKKPSIPTPLTGQANVLSGSSTARLSVPWNTPTH